MKMVRRAATEERTGEVREISARKDPEKADKMRSQYTIFLFVLGLYEGGHTSISQHTDSHHPRLLSMRQLKQLPTHVMQER